MEKKIPFALALCFAALAPAGLKAQTAKLYPINYDESQAITRTDRYTNGVTLASNDGEQSVNVDQLKENRLYIKRLDDCLFAKPGETVTAGFNASLSWMCGYAYIDLNNNGLFDLTYDDNGVTDMNELMAFSFYKNKDSKGNAVTGAPKLNPPSFVIPAGTKPGIYRMRYKVDWDNVDPGGNNGPSNKITTNGGVIVDTRINIHGDNVSLSVHNAKGGTATAASGATAAFGKALNMNITCEDGYRLSHFTVRHGYNLSGEQYVNENKQWVEETVRPTEVEEGVVALPAGCVDGDMDITPVFVKVTNSYGKDGYGLSFDKKAKPADGTDIKKITLVSTDGTKVSTVAGSGVYRNQIDESPATILGSAKAGTKLTPSVEYTGKDNLAAYLYIDYNNDGRFYSEISSDGATTLNSELVSFSYLNGKNSLGEEKSKADLELPAFTLPEGLAPGMYRVRLKIDGNDASSDGSADIVSNGGFVVDGLLNVHADAADLEVNGIGGHMVGADYSGVPTTVTFGKTLSLMPLAPASGYKVASVTVRHGHNLKGDQFDANGNRQWTEYTTSEAEDGTTFDIPSENVDGEVRVTTKFEADGTEEYKLKFADEFNGEDGSMPDPNVWHRCTRENPTWKRFTSQTEEGQKLTGFIRDGKLVTRCIANNIEGEGNVEMISGAVESSDKVYYNYGIIEGRLRTNPHTGNFPAFWLMPQDNSAGWPYAGEIDLWEQIDTENKTYHTVHTHVTYDLNKAKPNSGSVYTNSADYHIISMKWEPDLLTWYVDGTKAFSYAKSKDQSLLDLGQWPYDKPFYVILNQSVGNGSWARPCDVNYEYETLFDYVRIYQKAGEDITVPTAINSVTSDSKNSRLDFYVTDNGVKLVSPDEQNVTIANLQGQVVFNSRIQGNVDVNLAKGVYVIAGKKVVVK